MRKLILAFILLSFSTLTRAQSIKIPTDYEVGYFFGFQGHKFTVASELDMGVGLEGFYQIDQKARYIGVLSSDKY